MLSDRGLKALKPAPAGERVITWDAVVPGFGVRSTDKGHHSFVLVARFPSNPDDPTPKSLGDVGAIDLADARQKARDWLVLIQKGIDPKVDAERKKQAELRKQKHTFGVALQDFLDRHVSKLRTGAEVERDLKKVPRSWAERPITEIDYHDIVALIEGKVDAGAPSQARNLLAWLRRLFGWAIGRRLYGLR